MFVCFVGGNQRGDTPLYWAARHGHLEVVKQLCALRANINVRDMVRMCLNFVMDNGVDVVVSRLSQDKTYSIGKYSEFQFQNNLIIS